MRRRVVRVGSEVALRFTRPERALLRGCLLAVRATLGEANTSDPQVARLFPPAYPDDEAASREYRELMESQLLGERMDAIDAALDHLMRDRLSLDEADAFMRAINAVRLVLGTSLGVDEHGAPSRQRIGEAGMKAAVGYSYLSYVLEELVVALDEY